MLQIRRIIIGLFVFIFTFVVVFSSASLARVDVVWAEAPAPLTAEQWKVLEIELHSTSDYVNPFQDVEVTATFTGPEGEVIVRPGFWDGDNIWKVRFAPSATGSWQYAVRSNDSINQGLQQQGSIIVDPYSGDKEIYQRGFLKLSDDGGHLAYADGTPFFWLGDTHWFFEGKEAWDQSNKPGVASQFKSIVDRRVEQEFTVYQSVIFGPLQHFWEAEQVGEKIDPTYFRDELDQKMAYIADQGLVNAFGLGFHSNIDNFVEGGSKLAHYMVARYGAYPLIWITSGEGAGYDVSQREARIDGWRQVAQTIHQYDAYDHPQTAHSTALTEKESLGLPQFYEGEGWFDFHMFQGGHQKTVPTGDYHYYSDTYGLPFLESEANYEDIYDGYGTATIVRQSAYRSIQAGGIGFGYGAHGIWNAAWDDNDQNDDYGYGHTNWYDAIDFIGGYQMTHMIQFYSTLPLHTMKFRPNGWAQWNGEYVDEMTDPVLRADDEANVTVVYFNADTPSQGMLTRLDPQATYRSSWFNPREGQYSLIDEEFVPALGQWLVPEKPDRNDWLLVVEKETYIPIASKFIERETLVSEEKTVQASSFNQGTTAQPHMIVDGDEESVWTASGGKFPQWIEVDLSKSYELTAIEQQFMHVDDWQYKLEGSMDGTNWDILIDRTGAAIYSDKVRERVSGTARYIRMTFTGSGGQWASSKEFKVYAKINAAASLRSTKYHVDDREKLISKVPVGTTVQAFISEVTLARNATMELLAANGESSITNGELATGMLAVVTSEDGISTRAYTIETVVNKGENYALSASVSASSVESAFYAVENIIDGNNDTLTWSGWSADILPAWVELDFGSEITFNRVDLYTKKGYEQKEYTLQYWENEQWKPIVKVDHNTADYRSNVFEAVTSSKLRVWMTRGNVQQDDEDGAIARINELEVYYSPGDKLIERLDVTGESGQTVINEVDGTLQMTVNIVPFDATDSAIAWFVTDENGVPTTKAKVSRTGLLPASKNGTVLVTAVALDGSAVKGSMLVKIEGQVSGQHPDIVSFQKQVEMSSGNFPGEYATDGDDSTAWVASSGTFPQWIIVDLEKVAQIKRIEQQFLNEDQWKYTIAGSTDKANWSVWVDQTENEQFITSTSFELDETARFVRLEITGAKSEWPNWASSKAFNIYGREQEEGGGVGSDHPDEEDDDNGTSIYGYMPTVVLTPQWMDIEEGIKVIELQPYKETEGLFRIDASLLEQGLVNAGQSVDMTPIVMIKLSNEKVDSDYILELPASALIERNYPHQLIVASPIGRMIVPIQSLSDAATAGKEWITIKWTERQGFWYVQLLVDGTPVTVPVQLELAIPADMLSEQVGSHTAVRQSDGRNVPLFKYESSRNSIRFLAHTTLGYKIHSQKVIFADVEDEDWLLHLLAPLVNRGIVEGKGNNRFAPAEVIKRADFMLLLMRIHHQDHKVKVKDTFPDIPANAYYYDAITMAKQQGLVFGDNKGLFRPTDSITRQDMMVLLARYLDKLELWPAKTLKEEQLALLFTDASELSDYARSSAEGLVALGLIEGDGKRLRPQDSLTRAETIAVLAKVIKWLENEWLK